VLGRGPRRPVSLQHPEAHRVSDPTLTVDGYMGIDVIHFFPGEYEKIPRTRTGKKRQPRYMDLSI